MGRVVSAENASDRARRVRYALLAAAAAVLLTAAAAFWLIRIRPPQQNAPVARSIQKPLTVEADPRLAEARQALESKDYVAALGLTDAAEKQGAPVPAVEEMRAAIFRETDYLDREMESYQRWAAAAPEDAEPWLKLFYIYSDLAWKREAGWASEAALKRAPGDSRAHLARALFLEQGGKIDEALAEIAEAQRLNTGDAATLSNIRATFLLRAERSKEAEAEIRKAILKEPSQLRHRSVLAQALLTQGRQEAAAVLFREIQDQEPGNVEAAFQLGVIAEKQGDIAEATRQMERAAEIDAQYGAVLWNLMQLYRRQGRIEESKPLAKLYGKMNKSTSAFDNKISQLDARPGDLKVHWQLSNIYLASGEYPKAIAELRAIQHFAPKDELILQALHIALTKAGRVTEAKALKKSMQAVAESKKK